jgi:N-acetylglucosamine kinase-like BadF-type ATPase
MTGAVLAGDIGRTTCRLARYDRGVRVAAAHGACGVSLSDRDGPARVRQAILATLRQVAPGPPVSAAVLGITGAAQHPGAAHTLAGALEADVGAPVTVVSDVVAAHAGAFGGAPGVLTIAGTGAVALGISVQGTATLVDGWGPVLGDAGSAVDVGRAGLGAALRAHDGRSGGSPVLAAAATERFGDLDALPGRVQGDASPFRLVASFATAVAAAARAGDPVATDIFADAVEHLADTTRTAVHRTSADATAVLPVAFAGGLFALDDLVAAPVRAALAAVDGAEVRAAAGDALDGAHALGTGAAGLHHGVTWARDATVTAPPQQSAQRPPTVREET